MPIDIVHPDDKKIWWWWWRRLSLRILLLTENSSSRNADLKLLQIIVTWKIKGSIKSGSEALHQKTYSLGNAVNGTCQWRSVDFWLEVQGALRFMDWKNFPFLGTGVVNIVMTEKLWIGSLEWLLNPASVVWFSSFSVINSQSKLSS